MDDKWFKRQQKRIGVTAEDIANKMGRDRSVVSHIYNGRQKMSLEWAKAFAEVLDVPLADVLKHAGVFPEKEAAQVSAGFSDTDIAPFHGPPGQAAKTQDRARLFGGDKPGVDVWTVRSNSLLFNGYLPGDFVLVDTSQSELCRAGDVVIAQIYDWNSKSATTVLRRFEPPVLVAAGPDEDAQRVHVVDGNNVVIKGKVVASWRAL